MIWVNTLLTQYISCYLAYFLYWFLLLFLFLSIAWDAVMREMPVTTTGRIQFYSGQWSEKVFDAPKEIGNDSNFCTGKSLPLQIVSLMCLDHVDTRDQILLRVACTVNSCRDIKFVRRIACLISLSQRARLAEPSGAKCASRDNNSNVHIISQQKRKNGGKG